MMTISIFEGGGKEERREREGGILARQLPIRVLGSVLSISAIGVKLYCSVGRLDAPSAHCRRERMDTQPLTDNT